MIYILDEDDVNKPKKMIEFEFSKKAETFSLLEVYKKIDEESFDAFDGGDEENDFNSVMFIYLSEGDIWMNCGLTPPQEDIKLWVEDFKDKIVKKNIFIFEDKGQIQV